MLSIIGFGIGFTIYWYFWFWNCILNSIIGIVSSFILHLILISSGFSVDEFANARFSYTPISSNQALYVNLRPHFAPIYIYLPTEFILLKLVFESETHVSPIYISTSLFLMGCISHKHLLTLAQLGI